MTISLEKKIALSAEPALQEVQSLLKNQKINLVDFYLARFLYNSGEVCSQVLSAAALCSYQLSLGSVCFDASEYISALSQSSAVTVDPTVADEIKTPLVLTGEKLFLQRYWSSEVKVSFYLSKFLSSNEEKIKIDIERNLSERQIAAVKLACDKQFSIITGGPGTGKTTIVASIIDVLQKNTSQIIGLAAPTGKAAMRLQQSLIDGSTERENKVSTIHSLLGSRGFSSSEFRFNQQNKLALDVLIIDEASMLDLTMILAVLEALPENAKLILLGDAGQLPSVGPGNVFADLCSVASHKENNLSEHFVELDKSWRFAQHPQIGELADYVRAGDITGCRKFEASAIDNDVNAFSLESDGVYKESMQSIIEPYLELIAKAQESGELLAYQAILDDYQILTTVREARLGVSGINQAVEKKLFQLGLRGFSDQFYPGLAIMILQNHPALGLFNGDTGVVMKSESGVLVVGFPGMPEWRFFSPAQLPKWEACFATTVHKSQGSEYKKVAIVLPDQVSDKQQSLLSRELFYTAVTRAKAAVAIYYSLASLETTLQNVLNRNSGLKKLLS